MFHFLTVAQRYTGVTVSGMTWRSPNQETILLK